MNSYNSKTKRVIFDGDFGCVYGNKPSDDFTVEITDDEVIIHGNISAEAWLKLKKEINFQKDQPEPTTMTVDKDDKDYRDNRDYGRRDRDCDYGRHEHRDYGRDRDRDRDYGRRYRDRDYGRHQRRDYGRDRDRDYGRHERRDYGRRDRRDYGRRDRDFNDYNYKY